MRSELGGYFPKEHDKRHFFVSLFLANKKLEKIEAMKRKNRATAGRG